MSPLELLRAARDWLHFHAHLGLCRMAHRDARSSAVRCRFACRNSTHVESIRSEVDSTWRTHTGHRCWVMLESCFVRVPRRKNRTHSDSTFHDVLQSLFVDHRRHYVFVCVGNVSCFVTFDVFRPKVGKHDRAEWYQQFYDAQLHIGLEDRT